MINLIEINFFSESIFLYVLLPPSALLLDDNVEFRKEKEDEKSFAEARSRRLFTTYHNPRNAVIVTLTGVSSHPRSEGRDLRAGRPTDRPESSSHVHRFKVRRFN